MVNDDARLPRLSVGSLSQARAGAGSFASGWSWTRNLPGVASCVVEVPQRSRRRRLVCLDVGLEVWRSHSLKKIRTRPCCACPVRHSFPSRSGSSTSAAQWQTEPDSCLSSLGRSALPNSSPTGRSRSYAQQNRLGLSTKSDCCRCCAWPWDRPSHCRNHHTESSDSSP